MFNPQIFRAYDIRGVYGKDFDDDFAIALGRTIVEHFQAKKVLIGHDSRPSSLTLTDKISQIFIDSGCDVVNIGLATTPFFNFSLGQLKPEAGIMITASHNPLEYGGFKIYNKDGGIIGISAGLGDIKKKIEENNFNLTSKKGEFLKLDVDKLTREYVDWVVSKSKVKKGELDPIKFKIIGRSAVVKEIDLICQELNIRPCPGNCDMIFSFDEDSDRLIVSGGAGQKIGADFIVGLLAKEAVRFLSKPRIIYDTHFSRGVLDKFREWGIKSYRSKVGRFYLREAMIKHRADIGGEISGHIYFKENNRNELPLLAMLKLLKMLALGKRDINEMIKPFQTWFSSGRLDFPVKDPETAQRILSEVEKKYANGLSAQAGQIDKLDGITVEFTDPEKYSSDNFWWFNLRASNTEPLLRLIVEAKRKDLLDEKVKEIETLLFS